MQAKSAGISILRARLALGGLLRLRLLVHRVEAEPELGDLVQAQRSASGCSIGCRVYSTVHGGEQLLGLGAGLRRVPRLDAPNRHRLALGPPAVFDDVALGAARLDAEIEARQSIILEPLFALGGLGGGDAGVGEFHGSGGLSREGCEKRAREFEATSAGIQTTLKSLMQAKKSVHSEFDGISAS